MKQCKTCHETKDDTAFSKTGLHRTLRLTCKACAKSRLPKRVRPRHRKLREFHIRKNPHHFKPSELVAKPGRWWRAKYGDAWLMIETHPLPSVGEVVTSTPVSRWLGKPLSSLLVEVVEDRERQGHSNEGRHHA